MPPPPPVRRVAVLAAAFAGLAAPAADPAVELRTVPADAAAVVHVDVAKLWDGRLGQAVREAKPTKLERELEELKATTGIVPEAVATVTAFWPKLRGPGDNETAGVLITFRKPYDRDAFVATVKKSRKVETVKDGIITLVPEERLKVRIDATDPTRLRVYRNLDESYAKARPAGEPGPLSGAIKTATGGATVVVGVNLAALPDEIRGEELPPEVRPFQPVLRSESVQVTGKVVGDALTVEVRVRNTDVRKTADAEKSLAAGVTLLQSLLGSAAKQLDGDDDRKTLRPLVEWATYALKRAKVSADGRDAVVATTAKLDAPFGPFLAVALGGGGESAQGLNNLKQVGLALHAFESANNGFPPAALCDKKGKPLLSWRVMILPYLEQQAVYDKFKLDEPWDSEHNKKVLADNPLPPVFALPGVTKDGDKTTHVRAFVGNGALFDPIQQTRLVGVTDGLSNTLLAAHAADAVPWTKPDDMPFDPKADQVPLLLARNGKVHFLMADGSVRTVAKDKLTAETLRGLITKAGGEVIDLP